jgi:hypothetical protein
MAVWIYVDTSKQVGNEEAVRGLEQWAVISRCSPVKT